ncbi:MAG: hypothetical protein V1871_09760 [Planctomycetota bacterium]
MIINRTNNNRIAIVLSLILYLISFFGISFYHSIEILSNIDNCSACNETQTASDKTNISERCESDNPCHNSNHTHHNHQSHNHNCSLCINIQQHFEGALLGCSSNLNSDILCLNVFPSISNTAYENPIFNAIEIRGPPILFIA